MEEIKKLGIECKGNLYFSKNWPVSGVGSFCRRGLLRSIDYQSLSKQSEVECVGIIESYTYSFSVGLGTSESSGRLLGLSSTALAWEVLFCVSLSKKALVLGERVASTAWSFSKNRVSLGRNAFVLPKTQVKTRITSGSQS